MFNPLLHLTGTAALFGLSMFALDLLTSTTPFHNRKAHTMFTISLILDDRTAAEDYSTYSEAMETAIGAARELGAQLGGLNTDGHGLVYGGQDTDGLIVGTWSILPAEGYDDVVDFDALDDERAAAAERGDAPVIVEDSYSFDVIDAALDDAEATLDIIVDVDPDELALILTEADIDGWSVDVDDDYGDYLESVYSDPMEYGDDFAEQYS